MTAEEIGRITQDYRLVGYFILGGCVVAALAGGAAVVALSIFNLIIPAIFIPTVVIIGLLGEGAYLQWKLTIPPVRSVPPTSAKGFLDFVADAKNGHKDMARRLTIVSRENGRMNRRIEAGSQRIDKTKDLAKVRAITISVSRGVDAFREVLERHEPAIEGNVALIVDGLTGRIGGMDARPRVEWQDVRRIVQQNQVDSRFAQAGLSKMRTSLEKATGPQQDWNTAINALLPLLQQTIKTLNDFEIGMDRVIALMEAKSL